MLEQDFNRRDFVKMGAGMVSAFALAPGAAGVMRSFAGAEPLPVAVIGVGKQGRILIGELGRFDFVKIAAVCDVDDRRLKSAQRRAPDAAAYGDYRELLDKEQEVKAVFLATPSHLHKDMAVEVMGRNLHLYCEAPMATTVEDAKAIARSAAGSKGICHVGLQLRCNPIYELARSFLRSGAIRDVVSLRGQYHKKTSWRIPAGDPALEKAYNWIIDREVSLGLPGEVGIHSFDAVTWFMKKRPVSVGGWGEVMLYRDGREVPDTVNLVLTYPDEVKMLYSATLANSFDGQYELFVGDMGAIKLIGTMGWMFKEADAPTQGWEVYAVRQHFHKEEGITLIADATKLAKQGKLKEGVGLPQTPLYYSIENFFTGVVEGKVPTACPATTGLEAAVVAVKAHEAVTKGEEIRFEDDWFAI